MTPKQNKYYRPHFRAERGVQQGDIVSSTIFNLIIDAVIRASEYQKRNEERQQ
jgi:hypothetical protein